MVAARGRGLKRYGAQGAAPGNTKKQQGGRPRAAGKPASGGGKPGGGKAGGKASGGRLRSKAAAPVGLPKLIVEFAPMPSPKTLAERFALLEKQRQQLGGGRQRAAVAALGIASGGVAKKTQHQRRPKGKVSQRSYWTACNRLKEGIGGSSACRTRLNAPIVLQLKFRPTFLHTILQATKAKAKAKENASGEPAAAKPKEGAAAGKTSGSGSGKRRRRGGKGPKAGPEAMDSK